MKTVHREELQRLIRDGAQVVEVLPEQEFGMEHIAGAINIPLKQLDADAANSLDRDRAVVLYCNGFT